jgi:hydroxypyruvate isomerase
VTVSTRLAANVAWLFADVPWAARFAAARAAGFEAVEFPWPDDAAGTAAAVREAGLRVALLNAPAGDLAAGERGWPNDPSRVDAWRDAFTGALELADAVGCPAINVLAGNRLDGPTHAEQVRCLEDNLRWAVAGASSLRITVVTEVLNRDENPRYLLTSLEDARPMLARLGPVGWRLQLDTYHLATGGADVAAAITEAGPALGHLQVADVPGRHEPGSGTLDWPSICAALDGIGYQGAIGLEYVPTRETRASVEASAVAGW